MSNPTFHNQNLESYSFLVTGGAGFIGSNIVKYLVNHNAGKIRILDNLVTGNIDNITPFLDNQNVEFIKGDIRNHDTCKKACNNIMYISHQAALGSVPRSIKEPVTTNDSNVVGQLNILDNAKNSDVKRVVYASSSSVYGDSMILPKKEENLGTPLSPYAVSKLVNEFYADVFSRTYNLDIIGLRYFNVYGPNQNPKGPYAAVIPLFMNAILSNTSPVIYGDGMQTRDFTYVENAVQANIRALLTDNENAVNKVYNVACGQETSLIQLFEKLKKLLNSDVELRFEVPRKGDVEKSIADISKASINFGYSPEVLIEEGLEKTLEWFRVQEW